MVNVSQVRNEKTKNSIRNAITGFALKILELIFPFIVRTILIYNLGMEYSGLNSLFTSVLQTLNIAELGVGTCMTVYMYKPVNDGNTVMLCALMKLYKIYYRMIGVVILFIGFLLVPFLPSLIAGEVPSGINIYVIYALNLSTTVISYWLFAYRNSLFIAHQRIDIVNNITFIISLIKYIAQIAVLVCLKDYYIFLIVSLMGQIVINIMTAVFARKYYPEYNPVGDLDSNERKKINNSIKDLFTSQLGHVVTNSVGSITISTILGLLPLSIYHNYYYILTAIIAFFSIFYNSVKASIGNGLLNKSHESNYNDFKFIVYLDFALLTFCISCLVCLSQTFMTIWVGRGYLLNDVCVILFGAYLAVYELSRVLCLYKDAAGKWHADRYRPIIVAVINLILNVLLVKMCGIEGVLISTILTYMIINIPWIVHRLFLDVFDIKQKKDCIKNLLEHTLKIILVCTVVYFVCSKVVYDNLYIQLVLKFIVSAFMSVAMYIILHIKNPCEQRFFLLVNRRTQ